LKFNVLWDKKALDNIKRLDQGIRRELFKKIVDYLAKDPVNLGKPLKENMSGLYRYRMGNYRVIYSVDVKAHILKILGVGHRKNIY
jgi:mRNA interferase RelE/StbE